MYLHMPAQMTSSASRVRAPGRLALERPFASVLAHVSPEVARLRGSVIAARLFARVGSITRVYPHVPGHVAAARGAIVAAFPRALVRLGTGMGPLVLGNISDLGRRVAAALERANKWPGPCIAGRRFLAGRACRKALLHLGVGGGEARRTIPLVERTLNLSGALLVISAREARRSNLWRGLGPGQWM